MKVQSIALYQPEGLLATRIPGGVDALSAYIQQLQQRLAEQYVAIAATSRTLVVALTPNAHGFWLLTPTGAARELSQLRPILEVLPRPEVVGGPVAFAMFFNLGEDFPMGSGLPMPAEWLEVVRGAGDSLPVDDILTRLLG